MAQYIITADTDKGICKQTNQDSMILRLAKSRYGTVLLAAVCDGMGGLEKGEVASAAVVRALDDWFKGSLPTLLEQGITNERMEEELSSIISACNQRIISYSRNCRINMGTTLSLLLILGNNYYIFHVGDSRIYEITDHLRILTHDQTVTAREVAAGAMTPQQAEADPRRNVLLQCIGVTEELKPEFLKGIIRTDAVYMLCSDGFRHKVTEEEFYQYLNPGILTSEERMKENSRYLIELNKERQEVDNMSVAVIRT